MKVLEYNRTPEGLDLRTDHGRMRIQARDEKIIHVLYTARDAFSSAPSLMVLPPAKKQIPWSLVDRGDELVFTTSALRLVVRKGTCAFSWLTILDDPLVREPALGGKTLNPITVKGRQVFSARLELEFTQGEALYGLGQHEEGTFNYRGHSQYLYQHNYKVAMPVLVSTRGYALLFDSYSLGAFHDDQYGSYYWSEVEDELDFYFLYGPEFDGLVKGLRSLTGRVPLFPRWAYGYVQSKERYKTQAELLEVVQEYRRRGIPLDAIVLDWMSWPGNLWGQKTLDPTRFPDPAGMTDALHRLNSHLMVSVWPKFQNDGPDQVEMREKGFLLDDGATYDAFKPAARELFWQQAERGLFRHGIDGWWCDCTEPFEPDWSGAVKPEPWQRLNTNTAEFRRYLDPELINAFSLLHSQGIYNGQRSASQEKRVVNLTRSAYPGQQRYATITWSGDVPARWETLRRQIADGLNFVAAGNPRWCFDIGGFFTNHKDEMWFWNGAYPGGCEENGYRELYVRWFQAGAFLPMFRAHGTDTPREVWRFGKAGDTVYETLVKFIKLRYRLLPYLYSLAGWEAHRDYSMFRSLVFDFRADPLVYEISDQFMLGPALLVCPVLEPMIFGENSLPIKDKPLQRRVYLPVNTRWYDFWTEKRYSGGQMLSAPAPLESLPLFVRAGSILPFGPEVQYTGEKPDAPIQLRVYPGADGKFDLYEDEGDSYRYEGGEFAWTPIEWSDHERILTIGPRQGSYRGMPAERHFEIVVAGQEARGRMSISGGKKAIWTA